MVPLPLADITSATFLANPYPLLAQLRAELPVYRVQLPDKTPIWLLSRYEDVQMVLKDDQRFAKDRHNAMTPEQLRRYRWLPSLLRPLESNMLDRDPPHHTRLRALVHKAFTPRMVERMRDRAETITHELIDAALARGEMELVRDFALPLPMTIISEILGVPAQDRDKFHRWSQAIVSVSGFSDIWRLLPNLWFSSRYMRAFFKQRRAEPQDDLATALLQAEEAGDQLSEDELLGMVFLLLIAGHETTVNLIASGTLALLQNPDQLAMLRADPSLLPSAIEELLRYTTPVFLSTERYTRADTTLHGVTIPRGALVFGMIGSANRDESVFDDPDTLDITRTPNRHLSFGQGIHYCLGAPLARLEAQIALRTLLERLPELRLAADPASLRWRSNLVLRGLEALPVAF